MSDCDGIQDFSDCLLAGLWPFFLPVESLLSNDCGSGRDIFLSSVVKSVVIKPHVERESRLLRLFKPLKWPKSSLECHSWSGLSSALTGRVAFLKLATMISPVTPGLDALRAGDAAELEREWRGQKCALLFNPTGAARDDTSALDVCHERGIELVSLFSPEHGPRADREGDIESSTEENLPIHSLYGATRRPTPAMLNGLETILCDLQDVGARFYTYSSTIFHILEEALPRGIRVVVLDRPNPLGGKVVEGPIIEEELRSFIGYAPLPVTHGLTMGELARFFVRWRGLDESLLVVVPVQNWTRAQLWPQTGLKWRQPSPNLPDFRSAAWYPGLALLEFSGVSVGRGTKAPFQILAAPWLDFARMQKALEGAFENTNFSFERVEVTPTRATFEGQHCVGIRFEYEMGVPSHPVEFGLRVMAALRRAHPDFSPELWRKAGQLLGSKRVLDALWNGYLENALDIARSDSEKFKRERETVLFYG
ncbi:hypothetical protein IAD21_01446 [Abditibacteriota bacterium]|nr:hypothetical protein IAD21_01446 [Abditibacteriota bacterium]